MVIFQLENGMMSISSGIRPSGNSRKLNGHLVILVTGVTGRFLPSLMLEIGSTLMLWVVPETDDMKQSTVDCGNGGGALNGAYRHDRWKHHLVFQAVIVIEQIKFENGSPSFQVFNYIDPVVF
jgi:hypothetical protein